MAEEDHAEIVWPSDVLKEAVEKADYEEKRIEIRLAPDVEDVTFQEKAKEQLRAYAPDISQIGPGLYMERMSIPALGRTWGGLMVRALEEKAEDMKRRCLQYIYIWTEQKSVVSLLWMFWVPLLMGVWGLMALEIYSPLIAASELLLPVLATGFAGLPLLLTGVYDHRADVVSLFRRNGDLRPGFRSTTMLIPHSLMMWLVPFSWIWALLIIGVAVVFGIYWLLDRVMHLGTSHAMDYLPVFVWIKSEGSKPWKFERAYWDKFHYEAERGGSEVLSDSQRVRLQMDNPWHSVRAGGYVTFRLWLLNFLPLVLTVIALCFVVAAGNIVAWPNAGLIFVALLFVFVTLLRNAVSIPSKLVTKRDLRSLSLPESKRELTLSSEATKNHLSEERLRVLWNLVHRVKDEPDKIDVRPRFVVITKLQDPFNFYNHPGNYYDTFRDDLEYLYVYINHRCSFTPEDREAGALVKEVAQRLDFHYEPQDMAELEADPRIQAEIPARGRIDEAASRRVEKLIERRLAKRKRRPRRR